MFFALMTDSISIINEPLASSLSLSLDDFGSQHYSFGRNLVSRDTSREQRTRDMFDDYGEELPRKL